MKLYERSPEHDRRISRGDDFAGDAWRNVRTGEVKWCIVGREPVWNVDICGTCGGEWVVDSGGFTPWGQGIDIPCPECAPREEARQ